MSTGVAPSPAKAKGCCAPGTCCPFDPLSNASKMPEGETSLKPPAWKRVQINLETTPAVFASEFWIKVTRVLAGRVYTSYVTIRISVKINHKYHEFQRFPCKFEAFMRIKVGNDIYCYREIVTLAYFP